MDETKYPLTDMWIKTTRYGYIREYYSVIKRGILSFVTIWIVFETMMLSEINQRKIQYDLIYRI